MTQLNLNNVYICTSYEDVYEEIGKLKTTNINDAIVWLKKEVESGREVTIEIL